MAKTKFTGPTRESDAALAAGENGYLLVVPAEEAIYLLTGDDAPPPPQPPTTLSARKFWLAAIDLGYKARIDAMVSQMSERDQIIVSKEDEFDRSNPLFAGFQAALGVTDEEVMAFFAYGAALP